MDYCGLFWHSVDYHGLLWILKCAPPWNRMDKDMHPKTLTTPERYGAGMTHTVASIGHVLSCFYCGSLWITIIDYHGISWSIVDYLGLSLMMMDHGLWWIMMDYGLS